MEDFFTNNSVCVSVEAPAENLVQEIAYDGQEVFQLPLTLSENLTKQANKIDWIRREDDDNDDDAHSATVTTEKEVEEESKKADFQTSSWPWDSVRNKLRSALTEVCVLADVLVIAKDKRYMVLDPVQQEQPDQRQLAQLFSKKRGLTAAANILLHGAERLKISQSDTARAKSNQDFHLELLRLRQSWTLKKIGNSILGDLSYKSAGSRFYQTGIFEVTKSEDPDLGLSVETTSENQPKQSMIKVTIPPELGGTSYIQVTIQKDQDILCTTNLNLLHTSLIHSDPSRDANPWTSKLETAQNVLFCKELFSQLAREAVQLQAAIPHMVVGNQITASLFPGIQLSIHFQSSYSAGVDKRQLASNSTSLVAKVDHNYILEHSLHQLLRQVHLNNVGQPVPHPSSAPLGPTKRRRLAGPHAYDRDELLLMTKNESILEQIIRQGQHVVLRLRTMFVIDSIAREIRDPLIISHWNVLNSPTLSCVKIIIMTHGYDTLQRTALVVHVGEKTLKCICRDGRVLQMSYEPQELRDLILCQISQHQINAVQSLARFLGWHVASSSTHLGLGPVEPLGNASSCILSSPSANRILSVRCGPQAPQPQVYLSTYPRQETEKNKMLKDIRWEQLNTRYEEVRLEKIEGRNFLSRMELLMASLTCRLPMNWE
ncbi:mediator of RNA polymerase II transcription subunit 17-like [Daphnia carinata]|uniref:mediator of RNA polymerase II transcription subunit 17-like n=1 Tax=Daphnia carinata TaxID=120202 RepID=UPI00257FEF0E|nr:mediator of RNA polymerase II transcription subunit 17-like [Daphnia carinata]